MLILSVAPRLWAALLFVGCCWPTFALANPFSSTPSHGFEEVEFFDAVGAGDVEVVVVPRNARRVTLQVKNNTRRPLAIRLPHAFAGVPVLAQFGGPPPGGDAPQALGMGFPGGGMNGGGLNGGGLNGLFGGGLMNVPSGKIIKVRRDSVCLEHGKRDPSPRMAYRIAPLDEVSAKPPLHALLALLGEGRLNQRVAQAAAWHLTDGMTWRQIADLSRKHANGQRTPWFTTAEVAAARRVVALLPEPKTGETTRVSDRSLGQTVEN